MISSFTVDAFQERLRAFIRRHSRAAFLIATLVVLGMPFLVGGSAYWVRVATIVVMYVILVSGLNVIIGFTGLFSLGHAAFYGIGAYTSAMLTTMAGWSFWAALPLAGIVAGFFGSLIGLVTLRLRAVFLAFVTLGFGEIIRIVILNWRSFTRGPLGIAGVPVPTLFGWTFDRYGYYYLVVVLAAATLASIYRVYHSRVGRAFVAIREDETAARSMGIHVFGYKVLAFSLGCFFAGIAGSFFAHFQRFVSADSFANIESFGIITMVALGGTGSILGPVFGALILIVLPEFFRPLQELRGVMYGLILILVIVLKPGGLAGVKGIFEKPKAQKRPGRRKPRTAGRGATGSFRGGGSR
ncbi:MAG: branched-chain amino acid ABC transporter permease [Spirochaetaceae bacterium]